MATIDPLIPLVTPDEVRVNADHLRKVSDETLQAIIDEVHIVFIYPYLRRWRSQDDKVAQMKVVEKYLVQHTATLNVRRADSESIAAGISKSISVPKDLDLDQTEYGQMAKKIGKILGLDWSSKEIARLRIY